MYLRYASCVASSKEGARCLSLARGDFELCAKGSLQGMLDRAAAERKADTDAKAAKQAAEGGGGEGEAEGGGADDDGAKTAAETTTSTSTTTTTSASAEGGGSGDAGKKWYSYEELAAMNTVKEYARGVDPRCLERYLSDAMFEFRFAMDKERFYKLPKWKQSNMKRMLKLF